jgi:hypothetical protein
LGDHSDEVREHSDLFTCGRRRGRQGLRDGRRGWRQRLGTDAPGQDEDGEDAQPATG